MRVAGGGELWVTTVRAARYDSLCACVECGSVGRAESVFLLVGCWGLSAYVCGCVGVGVGGCVGGCGSQIASRLCVWVGGWVGASLRMETVGHTV